MMNKIFDKLHFLGHMSLGDSFVFSGIVHHFAEKANEVSIPTELKYFNTINTLYQDYDNIKVLEFANRQQEIEFILKNNIPKITPYDLFSFNSVILYESPQKENVNYWTVPLWDMQIYDHYELPFSARYKNFKLPKYVVESDELFTNLSNEEPYILVHKHTGVGTAPININGFRVNSNLPDNYKVIEINESITNNMMHYIKLIENAKEIHVAPSSFFCFVDSMLDRTNALLFYHNIRANTLMRVNSKWNNFRWNIVEYEYNSKI